EAPAEEEVAAEPASPQPERRGFFSRLFRRDDGGTGASGRAAASPEAEPVKASAPGPEPAPERPVAREFRVAESPEPMETGPRGAADPAELAAALALVEQGRFAEAMPDLRAMAAQGDHVAQFHVASLYHQGLGVDRDVRSAARWYRAAAEQGHADAQY